MEKICVAVRVRPPVSQESFNGSFWKIGDNRISLHKLHGTPISGLSYAFDHVFDESCSNAEVYELLTRDIIHAAVDGFNGTAFAYGQTSSGKTFTMKGSAADPGIIHRAVRDIFDKIQAMADREFLIRVSYMEIYNEDIIDLLTVGIQKLTIHESLERGIFVAGLREEIVNNADQVLELLESGEVNRHFGETNMNVRSSRSHTVFRMVIESKGKYANNSGDCSSTDAIRVSVLNLVDLAGSERIAKTGAGGVRLREGKHINKSLMALGNVINKLSEGSKQRAHIPYRDSKLTRILQPALGGNAKTSIICTVAPEEIHIEETKGTLQFASRAKRITNCAQVNEILTDAALLKRQKIEIEELRRKLQGSHAEVLEQEILKLRNEMLKYELEKEKLEMELEEERRSQKQREQCIKEQWMRIENRSNLVTCSDCDKSSGQEKQGSTREGPKEECSQNSDVCPEDGFSTPCFKAVPNAFVVKRSNYSDMPEFSPLPDSFSHVADEDTWFKMNKGYTVDLDAIQMTPARKVQSFPPSDASPDFSLENYKQQLQNLKRQLELVTKEKNEFQRKHTEQVLLNSQLTEELSKLKQKADLMQEVPERMSVSLESCKLVYENAVSTIQESASERSPSTLKLLSGIREIGFGLLSTLESQLSTVTKGDKCPGNSGIQEPYKAFEDKLKSMITSLILPEAQSKGNEQSKTPESSCNFKGRTLSGETSCERGKLSSELNGVKVKCHGLEREIGTNNKFLETCKERYSCLEREFQLLKEERDLLLKSASESSRNLAYINDQKENVLKELNSEVQRRKVLEEEIKQFSAAFASRHKSLLSFHNEFRSKIEKLRDENQNPVLVPKSHGCLKC